MSNMPISLGDLSKQNTTTMGSYSTGYTISIPTPVGYWDMGGTRFATHKTPNRFHRVMVRLFFGWKFVTHTTTKQMLHG
jgi:hypothetical protein